MNTSSDDVYYSETSGDKKPVIKLNLLTSMSEPSDKSECRLANLTRIIDEMTHSGLYQVESKLTDLRSQTINLIDAAKMIINYLLPLSDRQQHLSFYIDQLLQFMEGFLQRDLAINNSIGQYGAEMLSRNQFNKKKLTILTHSNTGSLATVGFGTALGVIRQLAMNNLLEIAYFTETRPYNHGSRLTAYEFVHDRIPHTMICDSMVGFLMRTQTIDAVVVGVDHVTANGDIANKIGTYQLAILAQYHQIPFYVATPIASIDLKKRTGNEIIIEQRPSSEMTTIKGINIAAEGEFDFET